MSEQNDVNLVSLLSTITTSIKEAKEAGRKFQIVDSAKQTRNKMDRGAGPGWQLPVPAFQNNLKGVGDLM
jgi:COP9 signalosome complex subunit 6